MSPPAEGVVISVNTSLSKGEKKKPVASAELEEGRGIAGDAHAGPGARQVSMLAEDAIERMHAAGADVVSGSFAENLTVSGIAPTDLPLGTRIAIGPTSVLVITQHGKVCHDHCDVFRQVGMCVMPQEGVFAAVEQAGTVRPGDAIRIIGPGTGRHADTDGAVASDTVDDTEEM